MLRIKTDILQNQRLANDKVNSTYSVESSTTELMTTKRRDGDAAIMSATPIIIEKVKESLDLKDFVRVEEVQDAFAKLTESFQKKIRDQGNAQEEAILQLREQMFRSTG